jgi:hypothetical protein
LLVRLDPARDRGQAIARLRRDFPGAITLAGPPAEVRDLQRIAGLPAMLAALVAVVALATMTHALLTSVRRRRRDLAILKALGFLRRQVAATIAWQATTFAVIALGLGIPPGRGRWPLGLATDCHPARRCLGRSRPVAHHHRRRRVNPDRKSRCRRPRLDGRPPPPGHRPALGVAAQRQRIAYSAHRL